MTQPASTNGRYGTHGRVLVADLTTGAARTETVDESVYRQFLGGYGLGAWLMWKHFPARTARRSQGAAPRAARRLLPQHMSWDPATGRLARARAEELGIADLLHGQLA